MSRIKDNIFVNGQLVGNPIRKEICQTENGGCDQSFNLPETNKRREKNKRSLTKIKIWNPVWITPFGDATCLIRNKICKKVLYAINMSAVRKITKRKKIFQEL